eukprot:3048422-Pyramimonas_sp.AAC.1
MMGRGTRNMKRMARMRRTRARKLSMRMRRWARGEARRARAQGEVDEDEDDDHGDGFHPGRMDNGIREAARRERQRAHEQAPDRGQDKRRRGSTGLLKEAGEGLRSQMGGDERMRSHMTIRDR